MWFVYMLRCADGTYYTGITDDIGRRLKEHNSGSRAASKYVRARRPAELIYCEEIATRSEALKRELAIKRLRRASKDLLVRSG